MGTADNPQYSRDRSEAPDPASRAFQHKAAAAKDFDTTEEMSEALAERLKPQIPQKKSGLDELVRLKKELEDMRIAKETAEDLKAMMEEDLIKTQEEAEDKDAELAQAHAELRDSEQGLAQQIQDAQRTISDLQESVQAKEVAAASQDDALEKQAKITALEAQVGDLRVSLAEERATKEMLRTSLTEKHARTAKGLAEQLAQLQVEVDAKNVEVREKVASATELVYDKLATVGQEKQTEWEAKLKETEERHTVEMAAEREKARVAEEKLVGLQQGSAQVEHFQTEAEVKMQAMRDEHAAKIDAVEQQNGAQIALLSKQVQDAQANSSSLRTQFISLQAEHASLQTQMASQMQVEVDQDRIAVLQQESEERRQRLEFFRKNSEYLSRRIKDAEARNGLLEQSEGLKSKQVEELIRHMERMDKRMTRELPPVPGGYS